MDFNDEDISVMKKFIHHKKDELPEMFYMDVETFKKYYVQNRVMEMKRESSGSRRSSMSSMHELDTLEREASLPREGGREKDIYKAGPHQSRLAALHQGLSGANIGVSHSPQSPARYGSPNQRSVAVQIQEVRISIFTNNEPPPQTFLILFFPAGAATAGVSPPEDEDEAEDPGVRGGGGRHEADEERLWGPGQPGADRQQRAVLRGEGDS